MFHRDFRISKLYHLYNFTKKTSNVKESTPLHKNVNHELMSTQNWFPFQTCLPTEKAPYPRALSTPEGLGDRLRFVAFAELQASKAFEHAITRFSSVSAGVKQIWALLAKEEAKHLQWLLWRMDELKIKPDDRPVSLALWQSFEKAKTAEQFAKYMANAEERGREAGELFYDTLLKIDPITGKIFKQIAKEEVAHIRLASAITSLNFQIPPDFDLKMEVLPLTAYSDLRSAE